MAKHKPIRIGDTVPLQQINPASEEIDGKVYVSATGKVLGRTSAGDGPHEEIDISSLGGGDSLGTGFTSGGGNGSIPDGTDAALDGDFNFTNSEGQVGYSSAFWNPASGNPETGFGTLAGAYNASFIEAYVNYIQKTFNVNLFRDSDDTFALLKIEPGSINFSGGNPSDQFGFVAALGGMAFSATSQIEFSAPSAIFSGALNMQTTSGAFIPPRLNQAEIDALTPLDGWTVFNTDLVELVTYRELFLKWVGSSVRYLTYSGLLSQSGTSYPTIIEFENTYRETITLQYVGAGEYKIHCDAKIFTAGRTDIIIGTNAYSDSFGRAIADNDVTIYSPNGDGRLDNTLIEVRTYLIA